MCIYFNNKLLRGNRTIKVDNSGLDAFTSPNMNPLASMDISIKGLFHDLTGITRGCPLTLFHDLTGIIHLLVNYESIFRSNEIVPFTVHDTLCRNVGVLRIFPSISLETIQAILKPPTQGVILETYGTLSVLMGYSLHSFNCRVREYSDSTHRYPR